VSRKNGFELGAGWNRMSKTTGEQYISVSQWAPEFGTIYGNVPPAPGDDPIKRSSSGPLPADTPPRPRNRCGAGTLDEKELAAANAAGL
jgi:hypothetical protein